MAEIDGKQFAFNTEQFIGPGEHTLVIYVSNPDGLPCVFAKGEVFASDATWEASCYGKEWVSVDCSDDYTDVCDNPQIFKFCYDEITPVSKKNIGSGMLYDFGKETFAKLYFYNLNRKINVFYGECEEEALDINNAYLRAHLSPDTPSETLCRAFRYIYIPDVPERNFGFKAYYEYLPISPKGYFKCSDECINKIWDTAIYTFRLNSREFFLDGIKRDRWVWSGDAYQSYLINRYSFFDENIAKRTIIALRGKEPTQKHINTILEYSFYWIMSVYEHYEMTGDREFIKNIYPEMESLMDFCLSRLDKNGIASQIDDDWIFIDWADMDKTGAVCAEQMLLLKSLESMTLCAELLNKESSVYAHKAADLKLKINEFFWDEELGAYIDSFESGKKHVTRHANIFVLLFGYATEAQCEAITNNVVLNDSVAQIKTPYFKFYELEALCKIGKIETVIECMLEYWGGMLENGATSFLEEYDPRIKGIEQYQMYADKFGKSLCHAWGAGPIYLIGRYILGVRPTSPGYETFEVKPELDMFGEVKAQISIKSGTVYIEKKDGDVTVRSDRGGGLFIINGKAHAI